MHLAQRTEPYTYLLPLLSTCKHSALMYCMYSLSALNLIPLTAPPPLPSTTRYVLSYRYWVTAPPILTQRTEPYHSLTTPCKHSALMYCTSALSALNHTPPAVLHYTLRTPLTTPSAH